MYIYCDVEPINCDVMVVASKYLNDKSLALDIINRDGIPMTWVTVNAAGKGLAGDEVVIKYSSEYKSMLNFFLKNGLVELTGRKVDLGFQEEQPVVRITEKLKTMWCVYQKTP